MVYHLPPLIYRIPTSSPFQATLISQQISCYGPWYEPADRFSQMEKGKWKPDTPQRRRQPIKIPPSDNSILIKDNKISLIGRVTYPPHPETKGGCRLLCQHWSVVGRITGRYLGSDLFQFHSKSEKDLQVILKKGPFHFKRWMLLLQRWEPNDFHALIPFWINIHGLPLYYWTDQALESIGSELGFVEEKKATKCRARIQVNGLRLLEMSLEISLPSGKVKKVEVKYENLEKHFFGCKSLSHGWRSVLLAGVISLLETTKWTSAKG
ncbi:hypothetical protein Bca101_036739 [Brassica carinata]